MGNGGEGGITRCARPSGRCRCATTLSPRAAPAPARTCFFYFRGFESCEIQQRRFEELSSFRLGKWRRGRDSNPRKATNLCWFSRPVHSTALPPLLLVLRAGCGAPERANAFWPDLIKVSMPKATYFSFVVIYIVVQIKFRPGSYNFMASLGFLTTSQ